MLHPVSRRQSPISTANPNAVNVAIPRIQPNRCTTGVNSLSAARDDRVIESVASVQTGQHGVECRLVAQLWCRVVEPLDT